MTAGRPDPDPWAPLPARYVRPPRRLRRRTLLVITIAGVLLLAGFGYVVDSLFDSGDSRAKASPEKGANPPWSVPTPTPGASTTSPRTATSEFTTIVEICALLPRTAVIRLVGRAKDEPDASPPIWECSRHHEQRVKGGSAVRDVDLDITLSPHEDGGTQAATEDFASQRQDARSGKSDFDVFDSKFGPVENLPGVGDEAYYQYESEKEIFTSGTGIVMTRVRNAIIEVDYGGYTSSLEFKSTKMADDAARSGAVEIARGVTKALLECVHC